MRNGFYLFSLMILVVGLIVFRCGTQGVRDKHVILKAEGHTVELSNDKVRLVLMVDSVKVTQTYYVLDNGNWKEIASSLIGNSKNVLPLYRSGDEFANDYRLLTNEGFTKVDVIEETNEIVKLVLAGEIGGNAIQQTIELRSGRDFFHIEVNSTLREPKLEYLLSAFTFSLDGDPDFTFVPAVKRSDEDVVGDRKFFGPAAIIEKNGFMLALVPDLDLINQNIVYAKGARPQKHPKILAVPLDTNKISFPTALDLDLHSGAADHPLISYGRVDYWTEQHVYWRHENLNGSQVRSLSDNKLGYGFDLFLGSKVEKTRGYQRVASYLWDKYGHRYLNKPKPQAMPFSEYAKVSYPASFAYQGYDVVNGAPRKNNMSIKHRSNHPELSTWQQWEEKGVPMGGLRLSAPQWNHLLYNTSWWNNVCDATGIYFWGEQLKDSTLIDKARRIVNFTLSSPQQDGIFPALYDVDKKRWVNSMWHPPLENYNPDSTTHYWNWTDGAYQTSATSVTAGYLLQYRKTCEEDPRILPFVQRYGDFLIKNMQTNGCVPAWFNKDLKPLPSMKWNADGGAHIWVLSELFRITEDKKYLVAAEQMAKFMMEEVMPHQKWYDFETFYSCAVKAETFFDTRTGQYPANNMSMSWALEGFASLYEVTMNQTYLKSAQAIADYSIFYQAIWAPHYIITAYPFGGFSSQNSDAEWLDQRSHRFANGLVRIGLLANRQDLLERGVAATRASLTLINHPRHIENDIYMYPNYPLGLGPENIDHEGFPQMPLRSGPSWCEVGGLAAAAHVMGQLGGVYYDARNNIALGIDGVAVTHHSTKDKTVYLEIKSLFAELTVPYDQPYTISLKLVGIDDKEYKLVLNKGSELSLHARDTKQLKLVIYPDEQVVLQ